MNTPDYPIEPNRDWPVAAGFWHGVDAETLQFPRCSNCGLFVWYPLPRCPACRTKTLDWTVVEPVGEVYSHTTVHRAFLPQFADSLPRTVILTKFPSAPGVTLVTGLADADQADQVKVGQPVRIVFPQVQGEHRLPLALLEG
jgi:uncharacterized OB-fold protein